MMTDERKALVLYIQALERYHQEQWDRAIRLLNSAGCEVRRG